MTLPQALHDFFQQQKARYDELFWYEVREQKDGGIKLILMIEKLAEKARAAFDAAREILNATASNAAAAETSSALEDKNLEIVSFEADDSIGQFYSVEVEQIDVETRPGKEEYQSIMDLDLKTAFTDQTNDIYKDQLVKVFQPEGYGSFCVVVYHSFGLKAPRGPIGWIKNLEGLKKVIGQELQKPQKLKTLEESVKGLEGVKYQIGGGSFKNGFDCSSLAQRIFYETKGIWLPRKARWQAMICEKIDQKDLKQGDLIFFNRIDNVRNEIDHLAIFWSFDLETSGGQAQGASDKRSLIIFHAKRINDFVRFEDLNQAKWLDTADGWEINGFGRVKERL